MDQLLAICPIDGRYAKKVDQLRHYLSEYGLIYYRVVVEIQWLKQLNALSEIPEVNLPESALSQLDTIMQQFSQTDAQRVKTIEKTTNHDVKAVEYFIKEKIADWPELVAVSEFIHFGCTSEDINNLAYGLMLKEACQSVVWGQMDHVIDQLATLVDQWHAVPMLGRTHGQPATPTTVGKELANFVYRLKRQVKTLHEIAFLGKMNGAVGNFNAHYIAYPSIDWPHVAKQFIQQRLGLTYNPMTTQIEPHDFIAELFDNMKRFNTILLDLSRDMWSYISQNYFKQKVVAGEVGSSTMPHKVNPIDFENAEGNLGLANALMQHLGNKLPISRWQRDLTDSTVMRNIGLGLGYMMVAMDSLTKGLNKLEVCQDALQQALADNVEVLGEAVQTVMRRYGIQQPYEKLKAFTRGKRIDQIQMAAFVDHLELPEPQHSILKALKPTDYLGIASQLARQTVNDVDNN